MDLLKYFDTDMPLDLVSLKATFLKGGQQGISWGLRERLEDHLAMLADEFSSRTVLEFFHAGTIVHIRRDIQRDSHIDRFQSLWWEEQAYLLKVLNLRWLVSACDTVVDVSTDPAEQAVAALGVAIANTVKLYETERIACDVADPDYSRVTQGPIDLFDGLTAFNVRGGDMVFNWLMRLDALTGDASTLGHLLTREIIRRVNSGDTVFRRFAAAHRNPQKAWSALI
jgi:hypothetical protein